MEEIKFEKDIMFGVATSSTQIEGGDTNSNWNDWYKKEGIKDGTNPARACDHYNRYKQDADLMASLNVQTYRLSLEWSRIEPKRDVFDEQVIEHYIDEIKYLRSKNILPLVTLHHFNNPMWFENLGGFLHKDSPYIFEKFVRVIVERFGDLVNEYITINEPNVYATSAYYFGEFPPGEKSVSKTITCMTNLARAHIVCYNAIHQIRKQMGFSDTKVGYASHVRIFEPLRKNNAIDKLGAKLMDKMFQAGLDKCAMMGKREFPIKRAKEFKPGKYYEFVGINYYSRSKVKVFTEMTDPNCEKKNDMGWEIYPEGIKIVCDKYYSLFNAPIYITENGTADKNDAFRSEFIYSHLLQLSKSCAKIKRYYHWSFIDNFEWMDGEKERFGIVHLDYDTQKRTIRKSGEFYSKIIENHGVSNDLIKQYLGDL